MKLYLVPTLCSLAYLVVALHLIAVAPTTTTNCRDDLEDLGHIYAWCRYMDQTKVYFSNVDENHFAGLLFALLALCCLLLAQFSRDARFVSSSVKAVTPSTHVTAGRLIYRFAFSSWCYALITSGILLAGILLQAHGLATMLNSFAFDGGEVWFDPMLNFKLAVGLGGSEATMGNEGLNAKIWMLGAFTHSAGFYCYDFFRLLAWWGTAGAAPPLVYACLFQGCRVTRAVLLPILSSLWFCYLVVRHVLYEVGRAKSYMSYSPAAEENIILNQLELELSPARVSPSYYNMFYSDFLITAAFSLFGAIGTLVESRSDGARVSAWSVLVALLLPFMCYAQPGIFNNLVWGGNPCPSEVNSTPGALWFKATQQSAFDMLVIRLFLIQGFGIGMAYLAKLLTQDHLPLGISFPIKSGWLRFALPAYFLGFWGLAGRLMQTRRGLCRPTNINSARDA